MRRSSVCSRKIPREFFVCSCPALQLSSTPVVRCTRLYVAPSTGGADLPLVPTFTTTATHQLISWSTLAQAGPSSKHKATSADLDALLARRVLQDRPNSNLKLPSRPASPSDSLSRVTFKLEGSPRSSLSRRGSQQYAVRHQCRSLR